MNLTCIIVDDEPNAVALLEVLIAENTQWKLLGKCFDALEAIAFLKDHKPDFIFLDINMPQLSGMELAGLLAPGTKLVFTTAYSEHAAESYMFDTIDYLLKPITLKRFLAATQKIESHFRSANLEKTSLSDADDFFFVKSGKVFRNILMADILYFEGEKEYVKLVTSKEEILVYRRLKDIEEQLSVPFIRIHNSFIVNTRKIKKIQDNHVYIAEQHIPISEKFKEKFMQIVQQRAF